MRTIFEVLRRAFGSQLRELFYTPMGYCVPLDSMVLTRRGWLSHDEVQPGDETIGYNALAGRSEWTKITDVVHFEDQPVIEMARRGFAVRSTPGHRWVAEQRQQVGGERVWSDQWVTTDEVNSETRLILSRQAHTEHAADVTPAEAALTAWLLGDGHVSVSWPAHEAISATIYQSSAKPATLGRLRTLLEGVPHVETMRERREAHHGDMYAFRLDTAYARDLLGRTRIDKEGVEAFVLSLGDEARAAFLQAAHDAEGSVMNRGKPGQMLTFSQNAGQFLDAVRLAAYLEGHRPTLNATPMPEGRTKQHYVVAFARPTVTGQAIVKTQIERQAVWCVTTELGSWTMRQDEQVLLTGNSIKNGAVTKPIAAAGHYSHVHAALAEGGTVRPTQGGTVVRLAEAGRAETVVDEGKMNALIERILNGEVNDGRTVVFQDGAIRIANPAPEPASESVETRMRRLSVLGV